MVILIPVSVGELFDKVSILEIKKKKNKDREKSSHIDTELNYLKKSFGGINIDKRLFGNLKKTNTGLWELEDSIRKKESEKTFDDEFIELARNIYILNDLRAKIKKDINLKYDSVIIEEKIYKPY